MTQTNVIEYFYHVFIVDATDLRTTVPVDTQDFTTKGDNVIVADTLTVLRSFKTEAQGFTLDGELNLISRLQNFVTTNAPNLISFTNNGAFSVPEVFNLGADRPEPLANIVNRGNLNAFSERLRADYVENVGSIAAGGRLVVDATVGKFEEGEFLAGRDVDISGENIKFRNFQIVATLRLGLDVSGTLTDAGAGSNNRITVGDGFILQRKPKFGDLLGTRILSQIPRFATIRHVWAAEDRGATAGGYVNNAAVGRLTLSAPVGSRARFLPPSGKGAMYVDFLELEDGLRTTWPTALKIDPNFTLYFADSNLPVEDLNGALGGRLQWVRDFAGPESSVDVVLENGSTLRINRALRESLVIDSDGDGTANGVDPTPLGGVILSNVALAHQGPAVPTISWTAAADTTYEVEYTTDLTSPNWRLLKSVRNPSNERKTITVTDPRPVLRGENRFYRVTYSP